MADGAGITPRLADRLLAAGADVITLGNHVWRRREIAPYLDHFKIGYELDWVAPTGAGQYAFPYASFFTPFGTFETAQEAADAAQADLQAGLDANQ